MIGVVFRAQRSVEELEILFSREERILCSHPYAGDNMILDKTTQWLSGCRNEILVVSIGDIIRLGPRDLVFCNASQKLPQIDT